MGWGGVAKNVHRLHPGTAPDLLKNDLEEKKFFEKKILAEKWLSPKWEKRSHFALVLGHFEGTLGLSGPSSKVKNSQILVLEGWKPPRTTPKMIWKHKIFLKKMCFWAVLEAFSLAF